eukprot:363552-Chlamydomonas_euryale.AAC.3
MSPADFCDTRSRISFESACCRNARHGATAAAPPGAMTAADSQRTKRSVPTPCHTACTALAIGRMRQLGIVAAAACSSSSSAPAPAPPLSHPRSRPSALSCCPGRRSNGPWPAGARGVDGVNVDGVNVDGVNVGGVNGTTHSAVVHSMTARHCSEWLERAAARVAASSRSGDVGGCTRHPGSDTTHVWHSRSSDVACGGCSPAPPGAGSASAAQPAATQLLHSSVSRCVSSASSSGAMLLPARGVAPASC